MSAAYLDPPELLEAIQNGLVAPAIWGADVPLNAYEVSNFALISKKPALTAFFRAVECTIGTYLQGNYHNNAAVVQTISTASGAPVSAIDNGPAQYAWPVNLALWPGPIQEVQAGWMASGTGSLTYNSPIPFKDVIATGVLPKIPAAFVPYRLNAGSGSVKLPFRDG